MSPYGFPELIPEGTIKTFELEMVPYPDHRMRRILVWLPKDYDGEKRFPVIYLHDGQGVFECSDGQNKLRADRAVSGLLPQGISAIVVAIDTSADRGAELTPPFPRGERGVMVNGHPVPIIDQPSSTDTYAEFVISTLKPLIDENFMTLTDSENTCIGGISAGGSASFYMFLRNPEVFGRTIVCSPGFPMFSLEKLLGYLDDYDFSRLKDHRIAFYNGDQGIDVTSVDYVLAVYRKFREKGMDRRHNMFLLDTRQTHDGAAWEKYLPEMIRFLFAKDNSEKGHFG